MFPFVSGSVGRIVVESMDERVNALIETVCDSKNEQELARAVKDEAYFVFFHVALINESGEILYDSHKKRQLGTTYIPEHTPASEAGAPTRKDKGISEEFSTLLGQKLIYLTRNFEHLGKKYTLRLAFPYEYVEELKSKFQMGFIIFSSLVLILFSAMTLIIFYHFTLPIREIIHAIRPYQEGKSNFIPKIHIASNFKDEFSDLANTLNSLSERIRNQIHTLTRERNEKEAILQSLTEGVLACDSDLVISYANGMALNLLNLDKNAIGKPFPKELHSHSYELLARSIVEGKPINDEIQPTQVSKRHLNIVAAPLEQKAGALLVIQDKSIQYRILEMRKEFIANASHELKTPITIIRGFAETLHDNPNLDVETLKTITEKIVKNSSRMTKIIKNLLTLADIEELPRFRLQTCDLKELSKQCVSTLSSIYPASRVEIECSGDDLSVEADPELLEVALMNLLDNASKYSPSPSTIKLRIHKSPYAMHIAVEDQGIGIPEKDLENIFSRFYAVDKTQSKKLGGSGLGLSIVETIIQKHFGKISVASCVGSGSTFTIEIPHNISERLPP
jgi:signal transduction histidine kinase